MKNLNLRERLKLINEMEVKEDVSGLIGALNDIDWLARASAASALGNIAMMHGLTGDPVDASAVEPLIHALMDDDPNVRRDAAAALGEIVPHLENDILKLNTVQALKSLMSREEESHENTEDLYFTPWDDARKALGKIG